MQKNLVIFRCDAGARYGLGHLSRCKVIAQALKEVNINSIFVISAPKVVLQPVYAEGIEIIEVNSYVQIAEDIECWASIKPSLVIVDSPNITEKYLNRIATYSKVCYIDDEIVRNFKSDLVINNHPWIRKDSYKSNAELLLGPRFNTINKDFFISRKERNGLLITMGGEDPDNVTGWILDCLKHLDIATPIYAVVGPAHPSPKSIEKKCHEYFTNAKMIFSPPSLLPYLSQCNIAFSAAGTTSYELVASNISFGIFSLENSQNILAKYFIDNGIAIDIGSYQNLNKEKVIDALIKLTDKNLKIKNYNLTSRLFKCSGASLIAQAIKGIVKHE